MKMRESVSLSIDRQWPLLLDRLRCRRRARDQQCSDERKAAKCSAKEEHLQEVVCDGVKQQAQVDCSDACLQHERVCERSGTFSTAGSG